MIQPFVAIARILLTGIAFVFFWTGGTILSWVILPAIRLRVRERWPRARACQSAVRRGFRMFHSYMHRAGLLDYDYRRVPPLPAELRGKPFVMVSNHPSLIDVTAISSAWDALCVVAKHPLFRSPMVGGLLRQCEHVDGGDGSPLSGAAVIEEALVRLAGGIPVLIFPEGTRSPAGSASLRKFKRGAFEIACRAQVPILPVLVRLDSPVLLKSQRWYQSAERRRVRMTVEPLAAIPVAELAAGATALARRAEARYREALQITGDPAKTSVAQTAALSGSEAHPSPSRS